jgi:hypothetical protein
MKQNVLFLLIFCSLMTCELNAQTGVLKNKGWLWSSLDSSVWLPLHAGVKSDDETKYLPVHSADYVRIQSTARMFLNYEQYVDDTRKVMNNFRAKGTRLEMVHRFTERIINNEFASDKGITRVLIKYSDQKIDTMYSAFHTISRKEKHGWKMLTEYTAPVPKQEDAARLFNEALSAESYWMKE